ncbi:PD-(D/E)XK motif protein [Bosea sp. BK604]|uniref:PD-(D/E)XK motif protein n=1 Tax=Bosea sp. BK604 TaxID=2512180 RepID=UPI0010460BB2|nr:PD-(D/E)XK motif protein [Bosea sp. BK604]TCR63175.1 putative PD-(D/E)XK family protein DUF4420 [Bosea sp. BK604]
MTSRAMTPPDDPWRGMPQPTSSQDVSARRVDAKSQWNFFWAIDYGGRRLLVFRHRPGSFAKTKLPFFKGFDVVHATLDHNEATLTFRLLDAQLKEPFIRLCVDIIDAAEQRSLEHEAITIAISRTWRWHHLLRGGSGRLGIEQQKGLLAELLTLRDLISPNVGMHQAVEAWVGPLGAAHDFRLPHASIECKATQGSSEPFVAISSEHQLDGPATGTLYLRIMELRHSDSGMEGSLTLAEMIEELASICAQIGQATQDNFLSKLEAAGVRPDGDYGDEYWCVGLVITAAVQNDFPRLVPHSLPLGVVGVRYGLAVASVRPYATDEAEIWVIPS